MSISLKRLPTGWRQQSLGELCEINIGRTPARETPSYWGPGFPWLSIADMNQGREMCVTKETVTSEAVGDCNLRPVDPGTVLLSFKLSVGKVGIAGVPLFTNEAIAALPIRMSDHLSRDYLYWAMRSVDFYAGTDRAAKGLTLNKAKLTEILKKAIAINSTTEANLLMSRNIFAYINAFYDAINAIKGTKQEDVKKRADLNARMTKKYEEAIPYATEAYNRLNKQKELKDNEKENFKLIINMLIECWERKNDKVKVAELKAKMKDLE